MFTSTGAHAPEVSMCQHIIAANLQTSFALYSIKRSAAYLCPACICDAIERRLDMPGQTPVDAASAVTFNHCDHPGSEGRACWPCLEAVSAELTLRWAKAIHVDKPAANQLRRIVSLWNHHHDPAGTQPRQHIPRHEVEAMPTLTASEQAEQRRVRADQTRIANRRARIRQQRSLPDASVIGSTGKQPETVVVVPPSH